MEEIELIQNAKQGDFTGLEEWIDLHAEKIERFAFQYGLTLDSAYDVTLDTYSTFRKQLVSLNETEQLVLILYENVLAKLTQFHGSIPVSDDVFPFKEDAELHLKIIQLNEKYRVPFILSLFHGLNKGQIATITQGSTDEVEANIRSAEELIGEDHLGKHIELLGKSYNRLPIQFRATQIIGTISQPERQKTFQKKSLLWMVVGVLVLIPFFLATKDEQSAKGDSVDAYFGKLEEGYKAERDKQQELLKLKDERFDKLNFIREADERVKEIKNKVTGDVRERKEMEAEFDKVIYSLKLPAEMIADVEENPLNDDELASIEYLSLYSDKVDDIITVYNGIVWDYREAIENYIQDQDSQTVDLLMLTLTKFPEELQNIIDTMRDHSIKLCTNKNTREITACYYNSVIHQRMDFLYHHNTEGYVNMLTYEYYLSNTNLEYSPDWIADQLQRIQHTVLNAREENELFPLLESYYTTLFYNIVKSSEIVQVLDKKEVVPENYQEAWRQLFAYDEATPLSYLARPIFEEMEASGWRGSESWKQFNREKIGEALKLARDRELEILMYGKVPKLADDRIELPDDKFSKKVEELYDEFVKSRDKSIFQELSPLYPVGVFDYANEMEDPETMFNLFSEDLEAKEMVNGYSISLETYLEQWQKGFSLFKDASSIEFLGDHLVRHGANYEAGVKITYNDESEMYVNSWLDGDQVWKMQETWLEQLPSSEESPPVNITSLFMEETHIIYDYFAETRDPDRFRGQPGVDILRIFLYAGELEDYEMQYALYFQGEGSQGIEREKYLKEAAKNPQGKMEDLFKTISFKGNEQDENGNWTGLATLTVDVEKNPSEEPIKNIQMMWTKNGWRVMFNPME